MFPALFTLDAAWVASPEPGLHLRSNTETTSQRNEAELVRSDPPANSSRPSLTFFPPSRTPPAPP